MGSRTRPDPPPVWIAEQVRCRWAVTMNRHRNPIHLRHRSLVLLPNPSNLALKGRICPRPPRFCAKTHGEVGVVILSTQSALPKSLHILYQNRLMALRRLSHKVCHCNPPQWFDYGVALEPSSVISYIFPYVSTPVFSIWIPLQQHCVQFWALKALSHLSCLAWMPRVRLGLDMIFIDLHLVF